MGEVMLIDRSEVLANVTTDKRMAKSLVGILKSTGQTVLGIIKK